MATAGSGDAARNAEVRSLVERVVQRAGTCAGVLAIGLAGSEARGTARQDSDVDLVVVVRDPEAFPGPAWAEDLLGPGGVAVRTQRWGPLLERRYRLPSGLEVEFGFVPATWAAAPVDPGTARVVRDGFVVLLDPSALLARLVERVAAGS